MPQPPPPGSEVPSEFEFLSHLAKGGSHLRCNISNPKTRTGPDFKSEEYVPFRGEVEDWNQLRGLKIWSSPSFRIWNDISYEYSLYWINFFQF